MSRVYVIFYLYTAHYAKSFYALALNGNARNHNEKRIVGRVRSAFAKQNTKTRLLPTTKLSTFPLILARLSLRSCLCSGCLDYCFTPSSRSQILLMQNSTHYFGVTSCWVRTLSSHGALRKIQKKRPLYRGQGWLFLGYIVLCQIFLSYFF